jgi:hypothetical protein
MVGVDDVMPPIMQDAIAFTDDMRDVAKPPEMMQAYIAFAPIELIDDARLTG